MEWTMPVSRGSDGNVIRDHVRFVRITRVHLSSKVFSANDVSQINRLLCFGEDEELIIHHCAMLDGDARPSRPVEPGGARAEESSRDDCERTHSEIFHEVPIAAHSSNSQRHK